MKRLFVAIEMPLPVKMVTEQAKALSGKDIREARWISPDNVHLTLKFLGNCRDEQAAQITGRLEQVLGDCPAFVCETTSLGVFPNKRRARILWLGVEDKPELKQVYDTVNLALQDFGDREARSFKPHITLARLKRPGPVDIENINRKIDAGHIIEVDNIVLFSSRLTSAGAVYEPLAKIKLSG